MGEPTTKISPAAFDDLIHKAFGVPCSGAPEHIVVPFAHAMHVAKDLEELRRLVGEYQTTIARLTTDLERLSQPPADAEVTSRCCGSCPRSAACSRNVNPNECVIFAPGPADAGVREAVEHFGRIVEIMKDKVDTRLVTLLRAAQSPRLTEREVRELKNAVHAMEHGGLLAVAGRVRAAFPELGEGSDGRVE